MAVFFFFVTYLGSEEKRKKTCSSIKNNRVENPHILWYDMKKKNRYNVNKTKQKQKKPHLS